MKQEFSTSWKGSKQPRKQRKYKYNAPLHVKRSFLGVHLSEILRKEFKKRALPVRKGDEVKILRGTYKGKTGIIETVNLRKSRATIEGIKTKKVDGSEVNISFTPSNLMLLKLNLEDKKRKKIVER